MRIQETSKIEPPAVVALIEAHAYVVLVCETMAERNGGREWAEFLGLDQDYSERYRHALIWSEVDEAFLVVIWSMNNYRAVTVVPQGSAKFDRYRQRDRMDDADMDLAKLRARMFGQGKAVPPYEVLISWVTDSGRPVRRTFRLANVVGEAESLTPELHRDALTTKALAISDGGADVRVTVRSLKVPTQVAMEFTVESALDLSQLRWMEAPLVKRA